MTRRVVFILSHEPPGDFERKFFVPELVGAGFEPAVWNIGPLIAAEVTINSPASFAEVVRFTRLGALNAAIRDEARAGSIFVAQFSRSWQTLPVSWLLTLNRARKAFYGRGYLPFVSEPARGLGDLMRKGGSALSPLALALRICRSAVARVSARLTRYDVTFSAGALSDRLHGKDSKRLVPISHFDIDRLRRADSAGIDLPPRYMVFLDEYLPHHPDFFLHGLETIPPEVYYATLNRAFDRLEAIAGMPVVIAAHPKASYQANPFGGRAVHFGVTDVLAKHSQTVLAHGSTAVSFAVICHRPVILLHSEEIRRVHPNQYAQMTSTEQLLGCTLLDMDEWADWQQNLPPVDETKYAHYYKEYLALRPDLGDTAGIVLAELSRL